MIVIKCRLTVLRMLSPLKTQEGNADGDVESKDDRDNLSDKSDDGTNEIIKNTANKGEDEAQDCANKTAEVKCYKHK